MHNPLSVGVKFSDFKNLRPHQAKRHILNIVIAFIYCTIFASCATSLSTPSPFSVTTPPHTTATAIMPIATTTISQVPAITLPPKATAKPTVQAITPTETTIPRTMPASAACPLPGSGGELPDLSTLHWETLTIEQHTIQQLTGLDYPVIPLDLSPDGRWLVVAFNTSTTEENATAVIDTQGDEHWWLNSNTFIFVDHFAQYHPYYPTRWLPDGQLLWIDDAGQVFIGNEQTKHNLNAPEPMLYAQLAANNIAFGETQNGDLWRVNLSSKEWEKVIATTFGSFILSHNGTYGLLLQADQGQMWKVSAEMGKIAQNLPLQKIELVGQGGPLPPSLQLADTPYWLISQPIVLEGELTDGIWAGGFVVDEHDGSLVTAIDLRLPTTYRLINYSASADGRWLAVFLQDRNTGRQAVYLAPTVDLTAGRIIELENITIAGWQINPPAVIWASEKTGVLFLTRLPLTPGKPDTPLIDADQLLTTLPGAIFTTATNPAHILQFDPDGKLQSNINLSPYYDFISLGWGTNDRMFLSAGNYESNQDCTYSLVEWEIAPSTATYP